MDHFIGALSLYGQIFQLPVLPSPERQVKGHIGTGRTVSLVNPRDTGPLRREPQAKRRQLSRTDPLHSITLAEPTERAARTVHNRHTIKTSLHNLACNNLSPLDFTVLVNQFGYATALHSFPLEALQPSDWLALRERACQQIVRRNPSFLPQLPAAAITCNTCIAAYRTDKKEEVLQWVPDRLKDSFLKKIIPRYPLVVLKLANHEQTFERLVQACCAYGGILAELPTDKISISLVTEVCRRTGEGLSYLPEKERSYELCLKACKASGDALQYVPEALKDVKLCRAALSTYGRAYRWFPEKLALRDDLQLLACKRDGAALQWIPQCLHTNELLIAACRSNGDALKFIEPKKITYEMCLLACRSDARSARDHIPEEYLDEQIRWLICIASGDPLVHERFRPDTDSFYETLLKKCKWAALDWVPAQYLTPRHYLAACQNCGTELQAVPLEYRTPQICLAACRSHYGALQWVPALAHSVKGGQAICAPSDQAGLPGAQEQEWFEWFVEAMHDKSKKADWLLTHAKRLLPAADFQSLLESAVLCPNSHKISMLTHPQVSSAQKKQLLEWLLAPSCWPTPEKPKSSDLCETASPLQFSLENPELSDLTLAATKAATHWTPPHYRSGQALLEEIDRTMASTHFVRPDHSEPLFHAQGVPAGGRTLKIDQGAQAFHYKFQRKNESLKTLMQEGVVHTVREKHPELFGPLHSKLPGDTCFFKLYLDQLPDSLPRFNDSLAIEKDKEEREYVHVYRYVASTDYSIYAHKADLSDPCNPYQKGEQGLLTACHDIGQFVGRGLVPTSTLPAFHDSDSGRERMALHALLGYSDSTVYPGTFGAWNSVATEYCDFGYGGFHDVGDFEPFGAIESFMKTAEAQNRVQAPELEQCFCLLNAVCENLLAAHLIRARLRQSGSDYHYKNGEAQQQNQAFIEQSLVSFLKGMYGDRQNRDSDSTFLRQWLGLKEPFYAKWLSRAAVEILYWTAKQPDPARPDRPPFADNGLPYSHKDGYALHLNRTGQLDPDLYPDNGPYARHMYEYPDGFHNRSERLNLGCNNAVFPLTTLMRGLTRLCTGILTYDPTDTTLSFESAPK